MILEIVLVVLLTVVNGVLSMSELAVVSSGNLRLRMMADKGNKGAAIAIQLAEEPGKFMSSVQIGITLVGILSGAVSGATLGKRLSGALASHGVPADIAHPMGVGFVVVIITYLSLVIGELVPKQIALRAPETVAAIVAPWLKRMATVVSPLVWLLDASGKLILRLLRLSGPNETTVSDEEVKMVISEARNAGVMKVTETEMINSVMRVADRNVRGIMTPRHEIRTLSTDVNFEEAVNSFVEARTSRLPVIDSDENIIDVIELNDVLMQAKDNKRFDLSQIMQQVEIVSEGLGALDVLDRLRKAPTRMLFVYDEYGHFEGAITPMNLLEAIVGDFTDQSEEEEKIVTRNDGSLLIAGWMAADELADMLKITLEIPRDYHTVAGLVLNRMGHLPEVGSVIRVGEWMIEVVDMDGRRVDKVMITRALSTH